ncbi:MAG: hypothetical protein CH6_0327 [Candidatus Kapaibacterium sp.]|nr:MAG: hypothetical protein CH6_0327 [Candidatus Kapabacteria bacterium]
MSAKGGGAGKVYFILYLAVVLELLIIIVERDEAEEGLLKKQRETMRIVESILSQLQSGSGTEGINTRPQDEITIPPPGINMREIMGADIKSSRKYIVEVGVTDVSAELKRKEGESEKEYLERMKVAAKLANVQEIEYQIFFNPSQDPLNAPSFPTEEEIRKKGIDFTKLQPGQTVVAEDGSTWEFLSLRKLVLDFPQIEKILTDNLRNLTLEHLEPFYPKNLQLAIGPAYAPNNNEDSVFYYSAEISAKRGASALTDLKKRVFVVNFQPPGRAGWYKLRIYSLTNRILGVVKDVPSPEVPEDTRINIGTVTLTVKDLNKVKKELENRLMKYNLPPSDMLLMAKSVEDIEKFDQMLENSIKMAAGEENAVETISKIKLYGYITKLLTPGMSVMFPQNANSISFDVRVITPKPAVSEPTINIEPYIAQFDAVEPVFGFTISPYQGATANVVEGRVLDEGGAPVARIICRGEDEFAGSIVPKPVQGGNRYYRGIVERPLAPGKYKIEITHRLAGRAKTETAELEIFKTGLTDESARLIKSKLENAFYGYSLYFSAIPNSGAKIKSDQFRIYLATDLEQQKPPYVGLSIPPEQKVFLDCKANKLYAKIWWIQPITGKEVELLPMTENEIKQDEPKVNLATKNETRSQSGNKVKIQVTNITVVEPDDGSGGKTKAQVSLSIGKPKFEGGLEGLEEIVDMPSDPTIEPEENGYSITLEFTVNTALIPRGQDEINGIVKFPLEATAKNLCNGKTARRASTLSISFHYEREKGTRRTTPSGGRRR